MYEKLFISAGLTEEQAITYEILLKNGSLPASNLARKSPFKRSLVYKILDQLEKLDLVEKSKEKGKIALFKPKHPAKLRSLSQNREQEAKDAQIALHGMMPRLVSDFNLAHGKPNVRFFEGKKGIIQVFEEMLEENADINSIEGRGEMAALLPQYHKTFVRRRVAKGLYNRVICPDSNRLNPSSDEELRITRKIPTDKYPLSIDVTTVKNKVMISTFERGSAVGIVIDHPVIARNFRILFQFMWDSLEKQKG